LLCSTNLSNDLTWPKWKENGMPKAVASAASLWGTGRALRCSTPLESRHCRQCCSLRLWWYLKILIRWGADSVSCIRGPDDVCDCAYADMQRSLHIFDCAREDSTPVFSQCSGVRSEDVCQLYQQWQEENGLFETNFYFCWKSTCRCRTGYTDWTEDRRMVLLLEYTSIYHSLYIEIGFIRYDKLHRIWDDSFNWRLSIKHILVDDERPYQSSSKSNTKSWLQGGKGHQYHNFR
jgi:hypothetical protein